MIDALRAFSTREARGRPKPFVLTIRPQIARTLLPRDLWTLQCSRGSPPITRASRRCGAQSRGARARAQRAVDRARAQWRRAAGVRARPEIARARRANR